MGDKDIFAKKPGIGQPWDVVIIGSGPAAFTAAIYTIRGAASTLILGGESWGGQLMLTTIVDNWPASPGVLGPDLMVKMRDHATSFGGEFLAKNVSAVDFSKHPFQLTAGDQELKARSVIIATGAETKWLDAPGVKEFIGRGVSSCAPCDAPFFKEKVVAVVGGGDSAMEEALVLTKYTKAVTVIHRRDTFRASAAMQENVLNNPKIRILWNTEVRRVMGNEKVEKVVIKNDKTNEESELFIDGLFVAIGHTPSTDIFKGQVELDEKGYIKKLSVIPAKQDPALRDNSQLSNGYQMGTSVNGVFVAGDVHDYHYRQAITAAGFGCMAAMDALKYLEELKSQSSNVKDAA